MRKRATGNSKFVQKWLTVVHVNSFVNYSVQCDNGSASNAIYAQIRNSLVANGSYVSFHSGMPQDFSIGINLIPILTAIIFLRDRKRRNEKQKDYATAVWIKWRYSVPQTILRLIKVWFSASTFVLKSATTPIPQTGIGHFKTTHLTNKISDWTRFY